MLFRKCRDSQIQNEARDVYRLSNRSQQFAKNFKTTEISGHNIELSEYLWKRKYDKSSFQAYGAKK